LKKAFLILFFVLSYIVGFAQPPESGVCSGAVPIVNPIKYCSAAGAYNTANTTSGDVWFKFVAQKFEIKITVTGAAGGLQTPDIKLASNCPTDPTDPTNFLIGNEVHDGNTTIFTKGGLTPGKTYYIQVSGTNEGKFTICTENYNPTTKPGQDFETNSILCSTTDTVRILNLTGAGAENNEAPGTCLSTQANSAWYRWTAANSGSLVFTITPTKNDDIDWALFDLGMEGNTYGR
jgi:hypothetical protein